MAAALVGGAVLSSALNVLFDRLTEPEFVKWIRGKKVDQKLLGRLKSTLYAVEAILNDAERRRITEPAVKNWLSDLQDAVYVADDLLDEISTKAATQKNHQGTFFSRLFNSQDREMVAKIEHVTDTLESIAHHKDIVHLEKISNENLSQRIPSTSLVDKSVIIYGRDKDKDAIIKLLLDDSDPGRDAKFSVIPIVGMGGVGKTTLAQLVYNDDELKGKFDYQAWVCVSDQFDIVKVTKTVLEAVTSSSCNKTDLNLLQTELMEKLAGKKFLLVLDDMWNDRFEDWTVLRKPFQHGNQGSRILVTTRSDKVASVVQTIPAAYKLSLLSEEDCWSVFLKHSLLSPESREYPTLEQVGRKIVEKCKGLPLAIEALGSLLQANHDKREWDTILQSEIWRFAEDDSRVIPALRVSYHYLPSHLKQCFIYCSLYPQDYQFNKDELILLWMAQDFLRKKGVKTLEEIGREYFDELFARSFFQPSSAEEGFFVMHDLVHDLATSCAGEFYFRAEEVEKVCEIGIKTRHLSHNAKCNYPISKLLAACDKVKYTRTFFETNLSRWDPFNMENAPRVLLAQLKCLRALSFKSFPLDSLPNSICELIHLRYLDLSYIPIVTLPESTSSLLNLQTLKLKGCDKLHILPSGMQDLVNLRHLDIRGTYLKEMPKGMSKLKHLQVLSEYIVGRHEENGIKELGALESLHGSLFISNLENVISGGEALEAKMTSKRHLNSLHLSWSSNKYTDIVDSQTEKDILNKLRPHKDLKVLSINGYRGTLFPEWLGNSSWHNMTQLTLGGCRNCWMLPSLGQLPSLKNLEISHWDGLVSIGSEFYKNDEYCLETPFSSLETLEFRYMQCWQEWHSFGFDAFPQLKQLTIWYCPVLTGDLPNHLPALEVLDIRGCEQLACSLPIAPAILNLTIKDAEQVRMKELPLSLQNLTVSGRQEVGQALEAITQSHTQPTCLELLVISNCDSAISFPWACVPASLQHLHILNCRQVEFASEGKHERLHLLWIMGSCSSLTSFPLHAFPNLSYLRIEGCENLKCIQVSESKDAATALSTLILKDCPKLASLSTLGMAARHLERLIIVSCPEIEELLPQEGLPPNLRGLSVEGCEKLVSRLLCMDLHTHPLALLEIKGQSESVKLFPKEGLLPASLDSLELRGLQSLETIDCKGLVHLSSLQILSIKECPKLENMEGETLPPSLTRLYIHRAPLLGQRCRIKDPQIWPKISHIPAVLVDSTWIF